MAKMNLKNNLDQGDEDLTLLIKRLTKAPNQKWANDYLELTRFLLSSLGLTNNDLRLATTIPAGQAFELPVSVNYRNVLAPINNGSLIGFIYGADLEDHLDAQSDVLDYSRFTALRGEALDEVPFWVRIESATELLSSDLIRSGWINAAQVEMERAKSSIYRKSHRPAVYEAAMNKGYRRIIFDSAFPES